MLCWQINVFIVVILLLNLSLTCGKGLLLKLIEVNYFYMHFIHFNEIFLNFDLALCDTKLIAELCYSLKFPYSGQNKTFTQARGFTVLSKAIIISVNICICSV